jgi:hypothetical protein
VMIGCRAWGVLLQANGWAKGVSACVEWLTPVTRVGFRLSMTMRCGDAS